jgi:hypothetical protein
MANLIEMNQQRKEKRVNILMCIFYKFINCPRLRRRGVHMNSLRCLHRFKDAILYSVPILQAILSIPCY